MKLTRSEFVHPEQREVRSDMPERQPYRGPRPEFNSGQPPQQETREPAQYNPARPGQPLQGASNRPLRSFKDYQNNIAVSVWPDRNDPEQPKFRIDAQYRDQRTGSFVEKRYLFYSEALSVLRTLYASIAWACQEAGEPMPSMALEGEGEAAPSRREFREPGDAQHERARRNVRGEDYNSRPGKYEDDDSEVPF